MRLLLSGKRIDIMKASYILLMIIIVCAVIILVSGLSEYGQKIDEKRTDRIREAVSDALITCYALEGSYPSTLEYLSENYGLILDKEKYIFRYEFVGANIFPELDVVRYDKKGKEGEDLE
jgi:hypothetical protein